MAELAATTSRAYGVFSSRPVTEYLQSFSVVAQSDDDIMIVNEVSSPDYHVHAPTINGTHTLPT